MKFARLLFFFLLAVLAITAVLSLLMPTSQKIEHSVTINAPASFIYRQLIKLENFNKYAVWSQRDNTVKYTLTGTDGTLGASSSWSGHPDISGDGKIEIAALEENKKVAHHISFTKPKKGKAESVFTLNETNGITTVTWNFELATPRPWNIFNLFFSLDKKMGKDFEEGLAILKTVIEKTNGTSAIKTYEVNTMNFPATTFAAVRQVVKWADLVSFYMQHYPILFEEIKRANTSPGTSCSLFYSWDEKSQQTDVAAAVPVSAGFQTNNGIVQTVNIPASKAVYVNFYGAYDKLPDAYASIRKYIAEKKLEELSPMIEQYIIDPSKEKDTTKWLTKVVFLVK